MKLAYTFVAVDIFHYGHLRLLEHARHIADRHVCGLLTDDVCLQWNGNLVMTYDERAAVLRALSCVDEVIPQSSIDPTDNLKRIHERDPDAQIILLKGHQNWQAMPGTRFVESIGGVVVQPPYYRRLARDSIRDELNRAREVPGAFQEGYALGRIQQFSSHGATKAETLQRLQPLLRHARIEPLFAFTHAQWNEHPDPIVERIRSDFSGEIVVRSSARVEDSPTASHAGCFHTELNVDPQDSQHVRDAIDRVIESYPKHNGHPETDQVLVQAQTQDVQVAGVVLTRSLPNGAPYYMINYDTSTLTNAVTSGAAGRRLEIARHVASKDVPSPWRGLLEAVREIEALLDDLVLDIEFAITTRGEVVVFQVRPLAAVSRCATLPEAEILERVRLLKREFDEHAQSSLMPAACTLSDMSFWNPAEIIGDRPNNLAYSLYHDLILHRAWNEGLVPLGYPRLNRDLMLRLGNKPYIDVPTAFAALLPADLDGAIRDKLLRFYLVKLRSHPELHDKIEFEIVHSCFTPDTADRLQELEAILNPAECRALQDSLLRLTERAFGGFETLKHEDREVLTGFAARRSRLVAMYPNLPWRGKLALALELLDDARTHAIPRFARMARLAFVGQQYLKGLVARGVVDTHETEAYLSSIETVASRIRSDFESVLAGRQSRDQFIEQYGHLRPGTYDITKLPYAKQESYFTRRDRVGAGPPDARERSKPGDRAAFVARIDSFLASFPVRVTADSLLRFIEQTTQLRELYKFEFTKNLSIALEWLTEVGGTLGFDRPDLSHLSMECLKGVSDASTLADIKEFWGAQIAGRRTEEELLRYVALSAVVFERGDLDVVPSYTARPNFISSKVVTAEAVHLDIHAPGDYDTLSGKLVLLEKADPGYDWIFAKGIKGLITKYGGAASHMAIRCAEFGLPAAIGCDEVIYGNLGDRQLVELDCVGKTVKAVRWPSW